MKNIFSLGKFVSARCLHKHCLMRKKATELKFRAEMR